MDDTPTADPEGSLHKEGKPSFDLQWYSAHLGPSLSTLFHSPTANVFPTNKGGIRKKRVHFTVVHPGTAGAKVVIVNCKDYAVFRILSLQAAMDLVPLEYSRPTVAEHVALNAVLTKISRLLP